MTKREIIEACDIDVIYDEIGWQPELSTDHEDKGFCLDPWGMHKHGDTTGKLAINREKKIVNCWVCGGYTLSDYVKAIKGWTEEETWEYLANLAKGNFASQADAFQQAKTKLMQLSPQTIVPRSLPYFSDRTVEQFSGKYDDWYRERNISKQVVSYFELGVTEDPRRGKGIVFPHRWNGQLVGYQTRWLESKPKYTNTPDFPREDTVWGWNFAKSQPDQPIIVESVPTALRLLSIGWPSIATFGSQVTDWQVKLLRIFQQGVILAPDNDTAGEKWAEKLTEGLRRYVPILYTPLAEGSGADLGDLDSETLIEYLGRTRTRN